MIKKLVSFLLIIAMCASFCIGLCEEWPDEMSFEKNKRLVCVERSMPAVWVHICIFYDIETGVMYMVSREGGMTVMVDAEGKPLIYRGERK